MIIGENKGKVIDNIKQATEEKEYNVKVEVNDPEVTNSEKKEIINKYLVNKRKISYKAKNELARVTVDIAMWMENRGTVIKGIEKVEHIKTGAIITNNHFNPIDSTIIRKLTKKLGKRTLFIVGKEANMAMDGLIRVYHELCRCNSN